MEDYPNGRPERKTTSKGDDHKGKQPQREMTSMEEADLNGGRPPWKTASMEEGLNGRQPHLKNCHHFYLTMLSSA